jgi:predicted MFS family arabinose efflux permease
VPTLVHDRQTWLTFTQLGVYGYFLYGFGPSVPLLRDELGVSNAVSGLHGTALAAGAVLAGVGWPVLAGRLGRPRTLRVGLLGLTAGVLAYCLAPVLPLTMAGGLACGFFGSLVVTGCTVVLAARHGPAAPAAISEANAVAAGAGLVAPLLVGAGVSVGLGWRPGVLLSAVAAVVVWLWSLRAARRLQETTARSPTAEVADDAPGPLPGRYWLAWTVLVLCIGVEFSLTFWAADGLREHTGASPAAATAGVTAIVAGMFAGRIAGGRVALRVRPGLLLLGAIGLSALGFAGFWASTAPVPALAGLTVCGFGIALQFPLGAALAVAASSGRPDRGAGRVSFAAGLASGLAPFGLGALADRVGTHTAFLLVPVLLVAAAGCVLASLRADAPVPAQV